MASPITREKLLEKVAETASGIPDRHKYKDIKLLDPEKLNVKDPVTSVKYDGANYFMILDNSGRPHYISRKLSVKGSPIDRTANIPHLADFAIKDPEADTYNVELYHSGKDRGGPQKHAVATGILNSLPARAIATQEEIGPLRAALFDVIDDKIPTYGEKLGIMDRLVGKVGKPDVFHTPERAEGVEGIRKLDKETKDKNLEGVVITSLTTPESKNVRLKTKHYDTYNLKVTGVTQEHDKSGKPKDSAGALIVEDATGREVANVGTGLSRSLRKEIWDNKDEWIGKKLIQVKGYPSTKHRIRAPVYNGDADGSIDEL